VACATSPDALATFAAAPERFALVMTDYTMPALTGPQFAVACQHLRPALPVLLVTGWLEVPEAGPELAPGPLAVLHKPFSLQDLDRAVRHLLGARQPETAGATCRRVPGRPAWACRSAPSQVTPTPRVR
jgi:DNA-binding NtrC family response regulator